MGRGSGISIASRGNALPKRGYTIKPELSSAEIKAVEDYVNNDLAGEINFSLREKDGAYDETADALRSAINKGALKENKTLYRGLVDYDGTYSDLNAGDYIGSSSFLSTSVDPKVAGNFLDSSAKKNVVLKIEAAKGTQAIEPSSVLSTLEFGDAEEVLLSTDTRLKILSRTNRSYELFDGSSIETLEITAQII